MSEQSVDQKRGASSWSSRLTNAFVFVMFALSVLISADGAAMANPSANAGMGLMQDAMAKATDIQTPWALPSANDGANLWDAQRKEPGAPGPDHDKQALTLVVPVLHMAEASRVFIVHDVGRTALCHSFGSRAPPFHLV